ncbi:SGNH/GDSL hydrolase family protein [Subtercola lobariae]|uniref:SGNH hydrolase-type esterase domain-containing protein n=1 Tax=Subtercola lobariae TaxID=1588641 RepID=A0A917F174_9MICO|nr:SGNH/GDSL hydrolase family protein [Subtercola lobariae]GGF40203.1 hypothetical protein GCM10011399_36300 [Subtercola lobariae]
MTAPMSRRTRVTRQVGRFGAVALAVGLVTFVAVPAANASTLAAPAVTAATLTAPAVSADPLPTVGLNYVALGDSYSSGLGVDPQTDQPVAGCGQSSNNYPHQVAAALGLNLTDVTCAGATANNVSTTPQNILGPDGTTVIATAPVQIDALSAKTDIVTITVGGNNLKFTDVALACAAKSATGPLWSNPAANECTSTLAPKIQAGSMAMATAIAQTYAAVRAAAPNAKIFVLGYPTIAPPTSTPSCFTPVSQPNSFPFTDVDVPFLHGVESGLDQTVKTLVGQAGPGFTYVPTFADSLGHSACAAPDVAYVNGVYITFDPSTKAPIIDEKSLHPNAAGVDFMASELEPQIVAAFPATVVTPTPTPTPSSTVTTTTETTATAAASASLAATGISEPFIAGAGVLGLLFLGAGLSAVIMQRKQRSRP